MTNRLTPNPDVVFKRLDDRMVLVHLRTNRIFELNETGARVWELLHDGIAGDALVDRLAAEFDVDQSTLQAEIESLFGELVEAGLASP